MKAIMNDEVMERLIDTLMELQKKESTDLPLLKKQLAETEKGINNMLNASEPHMAKVTCFSAVLNGKTGYRRIRLKLRTAQICASSMPGTAGFHITGSPPDICLHLCSFRTSILILKDEQISINA